MDSRKRIVTHPFDVILVRTNNWWRMDDDIPSKDRKLSLVIIDPILHQMVENPVRIDVLSLFDETESLSILAWMLKYVCFNLQVKETTI
jgi:hypothetical protein